MTEEAIAFKPFQVGWPTFEQHAANLVEAVREEQERLIKLRGQFAAFIIAWHIEKYNKAKPNMPYWEWVTSSFDGGFITPWLDTGNDGATLRRAIGLMFVTNPYSDEWRADWAAQDIATRLNEQFQVIAHLGEGAVPEFADLTATVIANSHNIVISYQGRSYQNVR